MSNSQKYSNCAKRSFGQVLLGKNQQNSSNMKLSTKTDKLNLIQTRIEILKCKKNEQKFQYQKKYFIKI
ncbi:unnamed protein product [Paramecium sonneborni]|uniref:Uncharacterized protein n=1 Tax=Paramecium sonneborni TaxID=65129 RepID=A0A8S1P3W2_9CILI|nr:unnamed protein product [Paramecium sonneborni]